MRDFFLRLMATLAAAFAPLEPPTLPRVVKVNEHAFMKRQYGKVVAGGSGGSGLGRLLTRVAYTAAVLTLVVGGALLVSHIAGADSGTLLAMPGLVAAKELRAERANLHEQYQAVLDTASGENRELNAEDREALDRIDERDAALKADIERIERHEERERELTASRGRRVAIPGVVTEPPSGEEDRSDRGGPTTEERRVVNAAFARWTQNEHVEEDVGVLRDAGFSMARGAREIHLTLGDTPSFNELRSQRRRGEARAQSTADGAGGYTIPDTLVRMIDVALLDYGGMREAGATVIRTTAGEKMTIPTSDDTGNAGSILVENSQVDEQDVSFGEKQLDAYKYSSDLIRVSHELLQDTAIDLPTFLAQRLGERLARITNQHFTTGSGSSQPNGVVSAAVSAGTTAGAAVVTFDELLTLFHSVDPAYRRQGARFMFSDATCRVLKGMKDGEGRPLWLPGIQTREPDTLLGQPYTINQDVADIGTGAKAVLFGAFSYYWIRDVVGIRLVRLEERYADYDQIGWVAFSRHDGELVSAGQPIKYLTQA